MSEPGKDRPEPATATAPAGPAAAAGTPDRNESPAPAPPPPAPSPAPAAAVGPTEARPPSEPARQKPPGDAAAERAALVAAARRWGAVENRLYLVSALATLGFTAAVVVSVWQALAPRVPALEPLAPRSSEKVTIFASGSDEPIEGVKVTESEADGFLLLVETVPDEATVRINGVVRGETPLSLNLECRPGDPVEILLTRGGYRPVKRKLACAEDRMATLRAKLVRAKAKP